ncbi:hypothetical protein QUB80_04945 [Chlorogloeopsis sp. ULAP01]|uniref:hypothetical protein n=1 Tax=Chlorogloeopsis sp. ULAP01 TaxID=3056483 RepID=UPI0025AAD88E|nr:hypothetical protein [Chlorogloeopsis sp. ULAP01]MDM9380045.1 hypothetical protein [Chlorogloeopsis sp. ULAP01]
MQNIEKKFTTNSPHRQLRQEDTMTQNGRQDRLDRIERMLQTHAEMLNQLSPLMTQVAQIATSTVESVARHDEILARLAEQSLQNAVTLNKLEQSVDQLAELVKTSTTETMQLVSENNQQILRIWEYLMSQNSNLQGEK